jgi:hypothetical protein
MYVLFDTECTYDLEQREGYFEQYRAVYVFSKCVQSAKKFEDLNINCARVAHVFTCSGKNTYENLLSTSCSAEYSRIIFMLFNIITVDKIDSYVEKFCGTELDIVYLTAAFEVNLFNKIG